jgi:hypothetical protein
MRDNISNTQEVQTAIVTLSGTTPAASEWIDVRDFDSVTLSVRTETVTDAGTASGFSFIMQESDTTAAADAATVAAGEILGDLSDLTVTSDSDDDKLIGRVGYVGNARYIRLLGTGTTGTDATLTVGAVLCHPSRAATTPVGTAVAAT